MPLEIEAKLQVDSHEAVRRSLGEHGAVALGRVLETNHILDRADGKLRAAGAALRVRTSEPVNEGSSGAALTFKGPIQQSGFKRRQEIEVQVSDVRSMLDLLGALGFVEVMVYCKRRESYRLERCRVELDEVPLLGQFVEIEGPDERSIEGIQTRLGLGDLAHIAESYIGLLVAQCERTGRNWRRIDFEGE